MNFDFTCMDSSPLNNGRYYRDEIPGVNFESIKEKKYIEKGKLAIEASLKKHINFKQVDIDYDFGYIELSF